ncbi:DUF4432 family protein [Lachnotalea glycerini]|uniref:DUF4432 family protein n=1 Tax=Lachnotalea glycerini TaxID=1763509 RepID=A0A371JKI5_9FIRM|nr:DUF4432 family protein [Lachnotalea glycerini]RDY33248.1 DUF4432 family protein [Lachnotalea glycerini]
MEFTRVNFKQNFFSDRPLELLKNGELSAVAFRYETGVCGLRIQNRLCDMVVLPYMGQQIWFAKFNGKNLTQRSIFDQPQATTKFGDNYGGLLLHCGLTNINCAGDGEDYPLHGELPFANYQETYTGIGYDKKGKYLAVGGTFIYRNSQEYHYAYSPQLRLYENASVAEMYIDIHNRRGSDLDYMFMCHMNWLAIDGSRLVYSAKKDKEHIQVDPTELGGDSKRAVRIREYGKRLLEEPTLADVIDSKTQCYEPEMCINIRYESDQNGWAHAMQVMPDGDACYVGFRTKELPYALRWFCRSADEDGIGIALPTTGTNRSTAYQKEHGYYNTLAPGAHESLRFNFGYLDKDKAQEMEQSIEDIVKNSDKK